MLRCIATCCAALQHATVRCNVPTSGAIRKNHQAVPTDSAPTRRGRASAQTRVTAVRTCACRGHARARAAPACAATEPDRQARSAPAGRDAATGFPLTSSTSVAQSVRIVRSFRSASTSRWTARLCSATCAG
jgi:hypothetical protein